MCHYGHVRRLIPPILLMLLTAGPVEGSWNLMMNESETRRILGVTGGLYYVRNGTVNDYALTFNLPLRPDITDIYFSWNASASQSPLQYRLSAVSSNANAIREPSFSIAKTGRIPTRLTGFSVGLPCSGLVSAEVDVRIFFNVTAPSGNTTVVEIRRRKACFVGNRQVSLAADAAGDTDHHGDSGDEEDEDEMFIAMKVNVDGSGSRGLVDGVILYACIGSACLASILVGALVVACRRRRSVQSRNVAAAASNHGQQRWQTAVDKHRLSAFDAQQKRQECVGGSEKQSHRNSASDCNRTAGDMSLPWSHAPSSLGNVKTSSSASSASFADIRIARRHVSMRKLLMEGSHGQLHYAVLTDDVTKDTDETGLLVKTVTDKANREDVEEMLRDACLLRGVQHSNVKSVAAICVEPGLPPLLVYRFDNDCNLKIYLQLCRTAQLLTGQQLMFLTVQITYALQFLHQQSIHHKDVAARNCTVDDSLTLRLGDSALASTLFPLDYHSFHSAARLPVKWMSMEALDNGIYSTQSDVWSLGVTLWEMITHGSSPYADVDVSSYLDYIRSGYRLPQLTNIPNELYALMNICWHHQPEMRPNCAQLLLQLNQLYSSVRRPSNNA